MKEEKQEQKKEEKNKKGVLVVSELPTQQLREIKDSEGNEYDLLTVNEALSEIVDRIRRIENSVA